MRSIISLVFILFLAMVTGCAKKPPVYFAPEVQVSNAADAAVQYQICRQVWQRCEVHLNYTFGAAGLLGFDQPSAGTERLRQVQLLKSSLDPGLAPEVTTQTVFIDRYVAYPSRPAGWEVAAYTVTPADGSPRAKPQSSTTDAETAKAEKPEQSPADLQAECSAKQARGVRLSSACLAALATP